MSGSGNRVVITGGLGFVGRALVNAFADRGDQVTSLDISDDGFRDDVAFKVVDIRDAKAVTEACAGADVVIHNASIVHTKHNREAEIWSINLDGTKNVLAACHQNGIAKLVYISSASAVYAGKDIENGDESLPYSAISQAPYADSKIAAEKFVLGANGQNGTWTVALRPHVIFGPGDNRLIPAILERAQAGKLKFSVGDGTKLSDFTYIDNFTQAVLNAADRLTPDAPTAGQAYFITNGEPMGFFEFVKEFLAQMDLPPIRGSVPFWIAYPVAAIKESIDTLKGGTLNAESGMSRFSVKYMCTHHYFSIEKARRDLDYKPDIDIAEGIRRTVAHLQAAS